jgi:type III pantothenate kinase
MLLALDIGNSNVTLGLVHGETIMASRRAATNPASTPDELEILIDGLLRIDGASLADVTAISLSSVVPMLVEATSVIAERRGLPLLVAGPGNVPMAVRVPRPAEVGPDRLVNALAVARLYAFVGGAIAPGIVLGLDALASRTARLPRIELKQPKNAIGTDTVSAIQSGAVLGHLSMTTGMLERIEIELARSERVDPSTIQVVVTGGLSNLPWVKNLAVDAIDPELTLKGLAILWGIVNGEPNVPEGQAGWAGSAAGSIHIISEQTE